ncbi:MAG: hypothetical protein L3J74_12225 [Bacteroidales bacterium]|nr:hypothetical protein [Bacteroidales bacterium]
MEKSKKITDETRRKFLRQIAIGGGVTIALGNLSFTFIKDEKNPLLNKKVII